MNATNARIPAATRRPNAPAPRPCSFLGLALGRSHEPSALAVLDRPRVSPDAPPSQRRPVYVLTHLVRRPPGTPYPTLADDARAALGAVPDGGGVLVVDRTAVGRAVLGVVADGLRGKANCDCYPVTVTAGSDGVGWCVPRRDLVGVLQALLQTRRLRVPAALPAADELARDLAGFRDAGPVGGAADAAAWRDGPQDDLCFAVALAAWAGERALRR